MLAWRTVPGVSAAACALVGFVCVLACALPARALASSTEQSIMMDDTNLIYASPSHVVRTLDQLKSLGVDDVKVSLVWSLVAPDPYSKRTPSFDATNPADYPYGAWNRYDLIDRTAHQLGMGVYFMIAPNVPDWAVPAGTPNQGPPLGRTPSVRDLHDFVEAIGRRYNGTFPDPDAGQPAPSTSSSVLGVPLGLPAKQTSTTIAPALPKVSGWEIWNEPNERSWLNPWYRRLPHGKRVLIQPAVYRGIVGAAWSALQSSGHRGDTILIGETANVGIWQPEPFVQAVYCVGSNDQILRGAAASGVDCPTSGSRAKFVSDNPGLFDAAGFAHHPYAFDVAPNRAYPDPSWITLENLGGFERLLNRIFATYGKARAHGVPLYLTEWGYKTDPPNPYVKTTQADQAAWLDEGAYMTWADSYVQAITQFLLVDSPPKPGKRKGSRAYWNTFQTGLIQTNGRLKPSYAAYRIPIWVPNARHASRVTVWGQLRPADHQGDQYAVLEFERHGSKSFQQLREVQTASPEGFMVAHVAIPSAGQLKLAWLDPGGTIEYSRTVTIR